MAMQMEQPATTPRFKYVLRAAGYFVVLALINVFARGEVYRLLSPIALSWLTTLVEAIVYLVGVVALTWAFCRFLDKSSLRALGLQRQSWLAWLATGWALAALLVALVYIALAVAGWATLERAIWQPADWMAAVLLSVVVSFNEELAFRGYIMQRLAQAWGMPAAVILSSLIFGLVHAVNPNAHVLGILSICLAGVLYAVAYLVTRSLWLLIGLHMGWNVVEMHVLGFAGSGHARPSIMQSIVNGPELMTGGDFGPEGGLISIAVSLIGVAVLLVGYRIAPARKKQN
jgi:membrane protease YdiL (CAAX protease family)